MIREEIRRGIEHSISTVSYCDLIDITVNNIGLVYLQYDVNTEEPEDGPLYNIIYKFNKATNNNYNVYSVCEKDEESMGLLDKGRYTIKIMVV